MTLSVLQIVDWDGRFENNRTRDMREMKWVPIPNRHDGNGYTWLLDHPNGENHYCAWVLIAQVASKCRRLKPRHFSACDCDKVWGGRGTLLQATAEPHDSASLARITRARKETFDEAIPRLIKLRWLEIVELEIPDGVELEPDDEIPQEGATGTSGGCGKTPPRVRARRKGNEGKDNINKRLHGIPSSVDEVIAYGRTTNPPVGEQACRAFWSHYEGQARTNQNGDVFWITSGEAVVTNWKAKLPGFKSPTSLPVNGHNGTARKPYSPNI